MGKLITVPVHKHCSSVLTRFVFWAFILIHTDLWPFALKKDTTLRPSRVIWFEFEWEREASSTCSDNCLLNRRRSITTLWFLLFVQPESSHFLTRLTLTQLLKKVSRSICVTDLMGVTERCVWRPPTCCSVRSLSSPTRCEVRVCLCKSERERERKSMQCCHGSRPRSTYQNTRNSNIKQHFYTDWYLYMKWNTM